MSQPIRSMYVQGYVSGAHSGTITFVGDAVDSEALSVRRSASLRSRAAAARVNRE